MAEPYVPAREHAEMFRALFGGMDTDRPLEILDAGAGRTSLRLLLDTFPQGRVDAVTYPGDLRKINSIKESVPEGNYQLMEHDLCGGVGRDYDIVVAHLLLGEATKFGNAFASLLEGLFSIPCRYLAVIDFPEDPRVDFAAVLRCAGAHQFVPINACVVERATPFIGKSVIGHRYLGYLFEHI